MQIYNYSLDLDINSENYTYTCHEVIKFTGNEEKLILNSVNLFIKKIKINNSIKNFKEFRQNQEIVIDGIITKDSIAEIDFTGKIPEELQGFYVAKTKDGDMFTTQFESTGARRFFPCIDNPSYKATFDITVRINPDLEAISNMPVESDDNANGKKIIKFMETPVMSTYLLYLGIGKFDERAIEFDNNKKLILAAQKGHLTSSDYPLIIGKKAIEFFQNYFGIEYPLPKEHLISVPEFAAGAMENWGAITFREIFLNISKSTGSSVKKSVGEVIAHELTHQWFGNLVTMNWWDDLWLNESFATFMSYKAMNKLEPDYDMFADFLLSETAGALEGDSLVNSHPIEVEVKDPDDISQIFDEISYGKGGSILRMINAFVTDDVFKEGLHLYLENFKYKNASGSDLWEFIAKVSDKPVRKVMESFIQNIGYPVIEAKEEDGKIKLNQYRFLLNGKKQNVQWKIPLTARYSGGTRSILFDEASMDLDLSGFIKLNDSETGFYRVFYSDGLYENILNNIPVLDNKDIFGILNDMHAFLVSGKITLSEYLSRINKFMKLTDSLIIQEISNELFSLYLIDSKNSSVIEANMEYLADKIKELGEKQKNENINVSAARGILANRYARINRGYAEELSKFSSSINDVDPDMRQAVLTSYAIVNNDANKLLEFLSNFEQDEDKVKVINAMAVISGSENIEIIEKAISERKIKAQDSLRYYMLAATNPELKEYIYKNLEKIMEKIQSVFAGSGYSSRVIEAIVPYIGINHLDEIDDKLQKMNIKEISRGIKKGMEYLKIYSELIKRLKN
ncbi:M1 family metallopeptidase [Ferroplasma sp.]|uniref:M1 family metallopeptidase n=1 Tax=Ferroplasma sp. TaxID=2591003 RepID=UPI00307ECB31